jgi:hypothetical protein
MYFKDTNARSGMIHVNSNRIYFLSGLTNSETFAQVNGQWPLYLQLTTNKAVFGGTITLNTGNTASSKFKVTQAVTNLTIRFGAEGANEVTIANNFGCSGRTIILHISCGGFATSGGLKTYTFRYKDGTGNIRATISAPFFLKIKQASITRGPGRKDLQVFPAANMLISVQRNDDSLRHDSNDFFTIVMEESLKHSIDRMKML